MFDQSLPLFSNVLAFYLTFEFLFEKGLMNAFVTVQSREIIE